MQLLNSATLRRYRDLFAVLALALSGSTCLAQTSYPNPFPPLGFGVPIGGANSVVLGTTPANACANFSLPGFPSFNYCHIGIHDNIDFCSAETAPCWDDEGAHPVHAVCTVPNGVPKAPRSVPARGQYDFATETWSCSCPHNTAFDRTNGYCEIPVDVELSVSAASETRPAGTGAASAITLTAKVTSGTTSKFGVALGFSVKVTPNFGGHDHDNTARLKGTLSMAQGTTDANGEVKVAFTPPEVAGIHTVRVTCATCSNTVVTKEIQVKVPNLVEMLPDTAKPPTYSLVGATANHKSNHWFTTSAGGVLQKVIDAMYKSGWDTVGVNDGSLSWGGLFDIKGGWKTPHSEHRKGTEVDLSFNQPNKITKEQKEKTYEKLCNKNNTAFSIQTLWHQDDGYPPHFHLYLGGSGLTSEAAGGACCTQYKITRPKKDRNGNPVPGKDGKPQQETVKLCTKTSPR